MYQVVAMYGDNEPWWFFEDWREDVIFEREFADFEAAHHFYEQEWYKLHSKNQFKAHKPNYLAAFWNEEDVRWCEECDDDLQQFSGLALLKDGQPVDVTWQEMHNWVSDQAKAKTCEPKSLKQLR